MGKEQSIDSSGPEPKRITPSILDSTASPLQPYTGEHICTAACDTPPNSGMYDALTPGSGENPTIDRSAGSAKS